MREGIIHYLRHFVQYYIRFVAALLVVVYLCCANEALAAEVLVIGDERLKPVVNLIAGIQQTMETKVRVYSPSEVQTGKLAIIVEKEGARTVIALGRESISEAIKLPTSVTVLYALVILPPKINRPNTAGMYMGTPIREYLKMVDSYLPDLKKISVIGSPEVIEVLNHSDWNNLTTHLARNAFDFVDIINGMDRADALLLLPDISLLTQTALEESYLYSFRKKVPLLGISKKHVRQGALFALEFDPEQMGRRLGMMATASLEGRIFELGQAFPAQHFSLYINRGTAKKMGIAIPEEMMKIAAGVYP